MIFNKADFIASYGISSQLPESDRPELSFSGRSNVGKSSLINKLCSRKNLARVSSTPGKTATINFYSVDDCYFVDLPGYGYAKVSNADRERWDDLINSYFEASRHHTLLVQLLDCRHAPSADDLQMLRYLHYHRIPYVVALTKADKLKKSQLAKTQEDFENICRPYGCQKVVARLRQHQGQFPGTTAKVGHNAVVDAVGFQLCMDLAVQGVVVCLAVEFIVKIGKFVVSHSVTPLPRFPQPLRR